MEGRLVVQSETYALSRRMSYMLMNPFGSGSQQCFMFVTSTIGLRTAFLPRWLAVVGFAVGLILLVVMTSFAWIGAFLFRFGCLS